MTKRVRSILAGAMLMAQAVTLMAGGLYVLVANPEANKQAREMGAAVTFKLAGCHDPETAELTATAIGVGGKRIPLKLAALGEAGTYALTRQWPTEGRWVLQVIAKHDGRLASTLVAAGPNGVERENVKTTMMKMPSEADIAALLAGAPKADVAKR